MSDPDLRYLVNRTLPKTPWRRSRALVLPLLAVLTLVSCGERNDGEGVVSVPIEGLAEGAKALEMVSVRAGTFTMGTPENERGRWHEREWFPHEVTLTRDLYMAKYEVTQAQWTAVMGVNPSEFQGLPNNPVEGVSWSDCARFCNRLSQLRGRRPVFDEVTLEADLTAGGFRMPTEAEWEYACRAGTHTRYSFGDALACDDECGSCELFGTYMWWCGNCDPPRPHEVGLKRPNPWGLYDMHGNVWEWCLDSWEYGYERAPQTDPCGPDSGATSGGERVVRGGPWYYHARLCRSGMRSNLEDKGSNAVGLRVVRAREP